MQGNDNTNEIKPPEEVKNYSTSSEVLSSMGKSNKKYIAILFILFSLMICLVIVVTFLAVRKDSGNSSDNIVEETPSERVLSFEERINNTAESMLNANQSIENIMSYFDETKEEESDKDNKFKVDSVRINFLIKNAYNELAINYLDQINNETLDQEQKYMVYYYYYRAFKSIGDDEKSIKYKKMAQELLNIIQENY